jgi:DNA-binding NarL/FixJ family response regulator
MNRPRLLLGDDHGILIEGLKLLLEPEFEIAGTAEDGRSLVSAAERLQPDAVITDITMPLLNGLEAARHLREVCPRTRIIFLTMHADVTYATEAIAIGALGYVLKNCAGAELQTAIREALQGRLFVSSSISAEVMQAIADGRYRDRSLAVKLTPRQREVLQLVAEGRTMKETAVLLGISPRTVEFHKYQIMQELGLHSTAELTQFAIKHGIVTP